MKKSLISLILALIFLVGAGQGMICGIAESIPEKDTPVAKIANDNYAPISDRCSENFCDSLKDTTEIFGGEYETYANEDEYLNAKNKQAEKTKYVTSSLSDKPVKKVFRVLDNLTSKPVANAIVRLNGVPRYTDKNGEVSVTLYESAYELYIEKNDNSNKEQYNPYIEFLYIEDEDEPEKDKTVYLKRPSDDLELYAVNLRIGWATSEAPEYYNLLEQSYNIALDYMDYPLDIVVEANKTPDFTYLYVNGKLDRLAVGNDFVYFDYNKKNTNGSPYYKPRDKFSVQFEYNGIKSKIYDLLLGFTDLNDMDASVDAGQDIENPQGGTGGNDHGIFGEYEIDISDMMDSLDFVFDESTSQILKPINRQTWQWDISPKFSAVFKPGKNTVELMLGFTFKYSKEEDKTSAEKLDEYLQAIEDLPYAEEKLEQKKEELTELENKITDLKTQVDVGIPEREQEIKRNLEEYNKMTEAYIASGRLDNYDLYEQRIRNGEKNFERQFSENKKLLDDVVSQIKSAGKQQKKMTSAIKQLEKLVKANNTGTGLIKSKFSIGLEIEIYGTWEYSYTERTITNFTFTGSVEFKLAYTWQFIVMYIPIYVRVEGGVKFTIEISIPGSVLGGMQESVSFIEFLYFITFTLELSFRADFGIGIYDAVSVGGFGGFTLEFHNNLGEIVDLIRKEISKEDLEDTYGRITFNVGIRLQLLFIKYEITFPDDLGDKWKILFYGNDGSKEKSNVKSLTSRAFSNNISLMNTGNDVLFDSVYQDSKPQLIDLGNEKYLLVWLQDSYYRDSYNRTELVYSVYENGSWGGINTVTNDCGLADFYPEIYQQGNKVYLTWQRMGSKIPETDSLAEMSAKSEIWFSEFNANTNGFVNVQRITNNSVMDFAPKFAVSKSNDDAVTLLWQKNTENDMLGIYGTNSIVSSTLINGKWSEKTLYSTENIISYVTGAYVDGKLHYAFVEDCDNDLLTAEDRCIYVYSGNNLIYSVSEDVGNPQFVEEDGKINLFYLKNGSIHKTENFISDSLVLSSETGEFNFGFKVVSNDNGTVIFYESNGENSKQSYCALLNASDNTWVKGVRLSDCNDDAISCTGFVKENGTIVYTHLMTDFENSYGAICFGEKQLNYCIEITDISYFGSLKDGEKVTLTVSLLNCGDYALSSFIFEMFGQSCEVLLDDILISGEEDCVNVEFIVNSAGRDNETLKVSAINKNSVVAEDEYQLFFGYSDYEISSEILLKNGVQHFLVYINSLNDYGNNGSGDLYVYLNGKLNQTIRLSEVCPDGKSTLIDVTFDEVSVNDNVYIEFVSDEAEKCIVNNYILIKAIADSLREMSLPFNPYENILTFAKGI